MPRGTSIYDQARLQGRLWTPVGYSNLVPSSEDASAWTITSGVTVTADAAVAPDGTATADQVVLGAGSGSTETGIYKLASGAVLPGDKFTISAWMKASSAVSVYIGVEGATSPNNGIPVLKSITTDWVRYWATVTVVNSDTGLYVTPCASSWFNGSGGVYITTSGSTLYVWGIQFTRGSSPGGYLRTTSASRTAPAGFQDATKDDASEYWRLGLQGQLGATSQFKNRPPLIGD